MRHAITLLLLLGLLVPCYAAEDKTDMTPKSSTASATLDIIGPDEAIEADEEVYLRIKGLTLAEVVEAQDAQLFDLTAFPLSGVKIKASYDWMFRTLDLEFRAKHPGEYLVKLHLVRAGKLEIASIVVAVEGDAPDPFPPPPPPPPPVKDLFVLILEEADDRSQGLEGAKLNGHIEQVRTYLAQSESQWVGPMDRDQPGVKLHRQILEEAGVKTMPAIVVSDDNSQAVVAAFAFGKTAEDTIALLRAAGVK